MHITTIGLEGPMVDALCIATLAARIVQSCVHISHEQTNAFVAVRFSFYSVQLVSFLRIVRALDLLDRLEAAVPEPGPSPVELGVMQGRERQRASG